MPELRFSPHESPHPSSLHQSPASTTNLDPRSHCVMCSLSGGTSVGMPSWFSKDPVTHEPLLVKDECQWQERNQADPSLMQQSLDVVGKYEVLGDPQEAWAAHRDCVCPPGPDTPENASCSIVDTRPTLAVMIPGCGAVGGSVHNVRLPSGRGQMVMPWIKGCHLSRLVCGPCPVSFFLICR